MTVANLSYKKRLETEQDWTQGYSRSKERSDGLRYVILSYMYHTGLREMWQP
jgi:hypothetical protein